MMLVDLHPTSVRRYINEIGDEWTPCVTDLYHQMLAFENDYLRRTDKLTICPTD